MLVSQSFLSRIINAGLAQGADFCEVYVEESLAYQMNLQDSKVTYMSGKDRGIGVRLLFGNEELYTYSNNLNENSIIQAIKNISFYKQKNKTQTHTESEPPVFSFVQEFPQDYKKAGLENQKTLLKKIDKETRQLGSSISQCLLSLRGTHKTVQVANSEGLLAVDFRPYQFFVAESIAEQEGEKERGVFTRGCTDSDPLSGDILKEVAFKSGKQALSHLKIDKAPGGVFPVIINKGFGGVIFHEACGHGLETTAVADKKSVFSDKLGTSIADPCVTAYDDGTLKGEYGFLNCDDEGHLAQKTTLIEKGVLKNYMVDRLGSQKTGYQKTGSARRQNYKFPPTSRMRNTFIAPGNSRLEDMIKDIDFGLFAESLGGGSVTPGTGAYNFSVTSARLIKNGKLDKPVKGASLIGNGLDTLSKIKKVGSNLELAPGHCGSISGWVPVTVGQPPILVSELTVGGQSQKKASSFK